MNIKEAKQEIINTVKAYEAKDETGAFEIPIEKQRPMLLIGPPGIGKTAIMEQVAKELGINLVAYTITHHTRQSAIGLPFIAKRSFDSREYSVTEYTMSEIVASVYDQIEKSGVKEGILFLDEINCVSETLAPTMLQFLQYKTFGTHRIPDGFVIVTAGNPPQYNKSVRDFDIVTLDRVKKIEIEEDFLVWKEYAYRTGVHGSILAYLEIRKENFYSIRTDVEEKYFVTARGWEDLSEIIKVYEKLGIPVTENLVVQYLQDAEIAQDFATYYELYNKYKNVYQLPSVLEGDYPKETETIRNAPFDEKLSLIGLLIDALNGEFREYAQDLEVQQELLHELSGFRDDLKGAQTAGGPERTGGGNTSAGGTERNTQATTVGEAGSFATRLLRARRTALEEALRRNVDARMLSRGKIRTRRLIIAALVDLEKQLSLEGTGDVRTDFGLAQSWFGEREASRQARVTAAGEHLSHSFEFLARTFGEGQEMVIFLSELAGGYYSLKFVQECGNEDYYKYNKLLLLKDRQDDLRQEILSLQGI